MGMPTFFLCPAVWPMAPWRAACGASVGLPLMPAYGVRRMDNPKSAVIVLSVFLLNIERIVGFAFLVYGRLCYGKTDENTSIETKRRLEGMNEQNRLSHICHDDDMELDETEKFFVFTRHSSRRYVMRCMSDACGVMS